MTEERLPLAELLAKAGDGDFLRAVAEAVVQLLMETDVEGLIHLRSSLERALRAGAPPTRRDAPGSGTVCAVVTEALPSRPQAVERSQTGRARKPGFCGP